MQTLKATLEKKEKAFYLGDQGKKHSNWRRKQRTTFAGQVLDQDRGWLHRHRDYTQWSQEKRWTTVVGENAGKASGQGEQFHSVDGEPTQ